MQSIFKPTSLKVTLIFFLGKRKTEGLGKMELLTYFKKLQYQISHVFLFLRSLLSLISQYSHISVWSIRWPFCAYSFPIKNVSSVATHISFGSWVARGLTCCKCAAVAECKSHQRGRQAVPRATMCHQHPTGVYVPTLNHLATMGRLDGTQKLPLDCPLLLCMYLFRKVEENVKKNCRYHCRLRN